MPYMPESPPATSAYSTLTLRARKSLKALRAYWANADPEAAPLPEAVRDVDCLAGGSTVPILTPRLDWESQGFNFAGWNTGEKSFSSHKSHDSTDTMAEFGDPFLEATADIDYTKSFFYKPATPPQAGQRPRYEPRKQQSIKSLKAALRIPVAPPVPAIPDKWKQRASGSSTLSRTPPLPIARLAIEAPVITVHSPGAYEDGRPPTPLALEGPEWDGHDIVKNWGKGVRKGKGKTRAMRNSRSRMSYDLYDWDR
jgi:hypothetical protein